MKKMTVSEFKARFSKVVEQIKSGEKIAVTFGKKKEIVGYFFSEIPEYQPKRKLGILEGRAKVVFAADFKITGDEFLES